MCITKTNGDIGAIVGKFPFYPIFYGRISKIWIFIGEWNEYPFHICG